MAYQTIKAAVRVVAEIRLLVPSRRNLRRLDLGEFTLADIDVAVTNGATVQPEALLGVRDLSGARVAVGFHEPRVDIFGRVVRSRIAESGVETDRIMASPAIVLVLYGGHKSVDG